MCCSSEPLARSGKFIEYVDRLCRHVLERAPTSVGGLAGQDWSYEGGTVADAQQRFVAEVGENVRVRDLARFDRADGQVWSWIHPDARRGVLLSLVTEADSHDLNEVAFQLAGQILLERVGEWVVGESGPEEIFDVDTLLLRPWARSPERTVGDVLASALGEGTRLRAYARFDVG